MNWFLDVFAEESGSDNVYVLSAIRRLQEEAELEGPCEDDTEVVAPYIDILPEESENEDASPLDFGESGGSNIGMRFIRRS